MASPLDQRLVRRATATRTFLVAVAVVGVLSAFLILRQARLLADAVAAVFYHRDVSGLVGTAIGLSVIFALRAGLAWVNEWLAHRAAAAVKSQLRTDILTARLARPLDASAPSGTLITLLTQGLDALDGYFAKYLPQLMMAVSVPLIIGVAILTQDLESAIIIAVTIPLIPLFMALIGMATADQMDRRYKVQTRLANHFADLVAGLPTLQVFGRARAQLAGLRHTEDLNRTETMKTLRVAFLSAFVLELLSTLSVAVVAVTMGFRVVAGHVDLGTALYVLILTPEVYLPIRMVGVHYHDSADGTAAADQAFAIIEAAEATRVGGSTPAPDLARSDIRVQDLTVTYPSTDRPALGGLSFDWHPGEVLALAGPSGAGKSTALAVLMGFERPTAGQVLVGGTDLQTLDMASWRAQIAYVSQDPGMVRGTIGDNVRLGCPQASDADVRHALDDAGGQALDADRPVGDEGEGLSAGERRRVALARALLRIRLGAARLLILDEPTAGLDQTAERIALTSLRTSGVGAILISHHPALLDQADTVVSVTPAISPAILASAPQGAPPQGAPNNDQMMSPQPSGPSDAQDAASQNPSSQMEGAR